MRRAFTLIELLIYMGLISILLVVIGQIFFSALDLQLKSQSISAAHQGSLYLLSRLNYDIHRASSIISPASAGQSATQFSLEIDGQTHTYASSSGSLQVTVGGQNILLTPFDTRLLDFSVTRLGNLGGIPSLTVNFTLDSTITPFSKDLDTQSYSTTYSLRQ
jgi:type II secretory pathway pseudopilin PulG